jgi:hypothetical protein
MTVTDKRRWNLYLARGCAVAAILSITLGVAALVVWYSHDLRALPGLDGSPAAGFPIYFKNTDRLIARGSWRITARG